ncbi:MAG: CBS domain-containing protein [Alphaproteobacteria bacterium]|nr:CBS domain-containing protein [Alphaproteobacteria bacterium]
MNVAAILKSKGNSVLAVAPASSVAEAAKLLAGRRIGAVLVDGGSGPGGISGILSERDIVRGLAESGAPVLDKPVSTLMTKDVVTCAPSHTLAQIMALMTEKRIRHLPVAEGNQLVGVISIGDVVKFRIAEIEREAQDLRDYIQAA